MSSRELLMGPGGALGYFSPLPIPFLHGKPTDIRAMNIDELKKFINFMYQSVYRGKLPSSFKSRNSKDVPKWWLESIAFDRFLTLKGLVSGNQRISDHYKHQLENLIKACYLAHGMSSLLAIGTELAGNHGKKIYLDKDSKGSSCKVVDWSGRTLVIVDPMTLSYDEYHGRNLRDKSSVDGDKGGSSDGTEYENGTENGSETGSTVSTRSSTSKLSGSSGASLSSVSSATSVSDYQCYKRNRPKTPTQVTAQPEKRSNKMAKKPKKASKRKLFEIEEMSDGEPAECKYCNKSFRFKEFCEDHEEACDKRPKTDMTLEGFMSSLGLRDRSQMAAANDLIPRSSHSDQEGVESAPLRSLRKLPKRNQLLSLVRNNVYPLSTERGKKMLADLGDMADKTFPPVYERECRPRQSSRGYVPPKDFPNVMKKAIGKDGDNAHVYSFGRKQRMKHYQELVVGLNHKSWTAFNKCKQPRLVLEKIKPSSTTLQLGYTAKKRTYLERQFSGAIERPRVRIMDFRSLRTPDPMVLKYLAKETEKKEAKKEAKKESPVSANDSSVSSCSSSDSIGSLFSPVNPKGL